MTAVNAQHWLGQMATATPMGQRLPKFAIPYSYVIDVVSFKLEPSSDPKRPGVVYLAATFTVVETDDPNMAVGGPATQRINLASFGGPGDAQQLIVTAIEAHSGQKAALADSNALMGAFQWATSEPCPLAGTRLFVVITAGKVGPKGPWPQHTYEPMQRGASKGLRATQAPAQAQPAYAPPAATPPWQQAPAQAQPAYAPPAATPPWQQAPAQAQPAYAPPAATPPWQQAPAQAQPAYAPPAATQGPPPGTPWPAGLPWTPGGGR